jgi:hypothetical protein
MSIETSFMGEGSLRSMQIPVSQCVKAPYSLSPEIPQATIDAIAEKITSVYEPAGEVIVRPQSVGMYEVVCGWHEVALWTALHPDKHIPVKSGQLSNEEAIALSIRSPYETPSLNCNRIWLSRAIIKAKDYFSLTDLSLSTALGEGYSRSTVNHLINLSRLSPDTEKLYLEDKINRTQLKQLCTLSFSQQAAFIKEEEDNTGIKQVAALSKTSHWGGAQPEFTESTGIDGKRFAIDIAERLGAPTRLLQNNNGKQRLELQFFDFAELVGIAEKLAVSTDKISGKLMFDVEDSGGFTPIVNALFEDEF